MVRTVPFCGSRGLNKILMGASLVLVMFCPDVTWAQSAGRRGASGGAGEWQFTPEESARLQELTNRLPANRLIGRAIGGDQNQSPEEAREREAIQAEVRKIQDAARQRWETQVPSYRLFAMDAAQSMATAQFIENIVGNPENRIRMLQLENSLLVSGATDQQLVAIQKFLDDLSQPTGSVRIFKLHHAQAGELIGSIAQTVNNLNIAVDARTNSLIVNAVDPGSMEKVLELVRALDQPGAAAAPASAPVPGNYKLELVWLTETTNLNPAQTAALRTPDRRLDAAVQELKAAGFRDVMQGGQVRLVTLPDMGFRARSFETLGELAVEGMITISENGKANLHLGGLRVKEADKPGIDVSTSVNLTPGEHLILGIAGTNPENASRRSAFVIRVEK